jgi:hypothetical protein
VDACPGIDSSSVVARYRELRSTNGSMLSELIAGLLNATALVRTHVFCRC